jgi:hypothetical protein
MLSLIHNDCSEVVCPNFTTILPCCVNELPITVTKNDPVKGAFVANFIEDGKKLKNDVLENDPPC